VHESCYDDAAWIGTSVITVPNGMSGMYTAYLTLEEQHRASPRLENALARFPLLYLRGPPGSTTGFIRQARQLAHRISRTTATAMILHSSPLQMQLQVTLQGIRSYICSSWGHCVYGMSILRVETITLADGERVHSICSVNDIVNRTWRHL
jgi:hypothetical protein